MIAHEITVPRSARYYTLGPTHGFPREVWIVCHGYGQLAARFITEFAGLDDGTRLIVAPEGLSRFYLDPIPQRRTQREPRVGATWMTREDRLTEIADYVRYLNLVAAEVRQHLAGASPRIIVLGFSQGVSTVSRWLGASSLRADQLVLWSGAIPPELDLAQWASALRGAELSLVSGDADVLVPPGAMAHEAERLSSAGVAFHVHRFNGGHTIDPGALLAVAERLQGG